MALQDDNAVMMDSRVRNLLPSGSTNLCCSRDDDDAAMLNLSVAAHLVQRRNGTVLRVL